MGRTLYDKIWDAHLVSEGPPSLIYIDRHLVHEVTSPQAFEGLRAAGRKVRRPDLTLAVADHNVPTSDRARGIADPESRMQIEALERNTREFGVEYLSMADIRQGIVHIVGRSRAGRFPAPPSSAATATPRPMARSARSPSASAPARSSTCSRPRPCRWCAPGTCACASTERSASA